MAITLFFTHAQKSNGFAMPSRDGWRRGQLKKGQSDGAVGDAGKWSKVRAEKGDVMKRIERIVVQVGPENYLGVGGAASLYLDHLDRSHEPQPKFPKFNYVAIVVNVEANGIRHQTHDYIRHDDFESQFERMMKYITERVREAYKKLPDEPE